jgi:UDP-2,3-diacylglucosamine hydrolase
MLPARLVEACEVRRRPYFVIAIIGQADPSVVAEGGRTLRPHAWVRLGAGGKMLRLLRAAEVREVVMAGSIRRPSLAELRPDLWTLRFLARSGAGNAKDNAALSAIVAALEEEGFRVLAVDDVMPEVLAPSGVCGRVSPTDAARRDIKAGIEAARELGLRDEGQGVVVRDGIVVAREDAAGTDAMLVRCRPPRSGAAGGVLVKMAKPGQERRADLPAIGVQTVENAKAAGLSGIAVEAGAALIIDRDAVCRAADAAGLFIVGVDAADGRR